MEYSSGATDVYAYSADELTALVPLPAADANKYTRGKLVALVGSARYPGAACLVAVASQRMGAGYTEVITAPEAADIVRSASPSLVVRSWMGLQPGDFTPATPGKPCAWVVGSGFDVNDNEARSHLVLKQAASPVLVDGGGLDALASEKGRSLLKRRFVNGWPTVVTPHAGEAARLAAPLNIPVDDPAHMARNLALAYGVVVVMKGPATYISDGDRIVQMTQGTPALAKAGTGDVLAGMIGALLAQGLDPLDACVLAAEIHARAGRIAAERLTTICVCAEDVVAAIAPAIISLAEEAPTRAVSQTNVKGG